MLTEILTTAFREGADEAHIQANLPVVIFVRGELCPTEYWPRSLDESDGLVQRALGDESASTHLDRHGWATASGSHAAGRFRVSAYRERGALGARLRLFPHHVLRKGVPLPKGAGDLVRARSGLVLVAAPPGEGVTTTLAGLMTLAVQEGRTVLSLEQPQEYHLEGVTQFQVGHEPGGWAEAYLAARASRKELVAVSEVDSKERLEAALELAERGKLVLAGLSAPGALDGLRMSLEGWQETSRPPLAQRLGAQLRGVLGCRLVRSHNQKLLVHELLLATEVVAALISEQRWFRLYNIMETGHLQGMMTLEQSLRKAAEDGLISPGDALDAAPNPDRLKDLVSGEHRADHGR